MAYPEDLSTDRGGYINGLYTTLFGRTPDEGGFETQYNSGLSNDQLWKNFIGSDEYKAQQPAPTMPAPAPATSNFALGPGAQIPTDQWGRAQPYLDPFGGGWHNLDSGWGWDAPTMQQTPTPAAPATLMTPTAPTGIQYQDPSTYTNAPMANGAFDPLDLGAAAMGHAPTAFR